jgi:hypothetical protein
MLVYAGRVLFFLLYVEVDVRRTAAAELCDDHGRSDGTSSVAVPQDEDEFAELRRKLAGKASLIVRQEPLYVGAVVRKIHGVQLARQREQRLFVGGYGAPDLVPAHVDPVGAASPRPAALPIITLRSITRENGRA